MRLPMDIGAHLVRSRVELYDLALRPRLAGRQPSPAIAAGPALEIAQIIAAQPNLRPQGWPSGHLAFRHYARLAASSRSMASNAPHLGYKLIDSMMEAQVFECAVIGRCLPAMLQVPWTLTDLDGKDDVGALAPYNQYWLGVGSGDKVLRERCIDYLARRATSSRAWDPGVVATPHRLATALRALEDRDSTSLQRTLKAILLSHHKAALRAEDELPQYPGSRYTNPYWLVCRTAFAILVRCWETGLELEVESEYLPNSLLEDLHPSLPPVTASLDYAELDHLRDRVE